MTKASDVFHYGASESNEHSMGPDEQRPQSARTSELVPPRPSTGERPVDSRGSGRLTPASQTRLLILALTIILIGTAAGWAAAFVLPKTYGARAELFYPISQGQQNGDPLQQDRQLSTQLVYLKSRAVLGPIAQKQGRQFSDLDSDLSVQILQNSEVIQVEAHGSTAEAARQTLQAVMAGYLALSGQPTGVTRNLGIQLAEAHANTVQLQTRAQQLVAAVLAGTATQASLDATRAQIVVSQDREKAIQARIDELTLTGQTGTDAQLLTPPYPLPDPVSPQLLITIGSGALVGLIVAGVVVAVASRRLRGRADPT
ncbi:MAG TPA: hypothetical protein VIY28_12425 [Pseudonocardiaceae bacterium]